ncbi:hypothetical protein EV424DRAFT_1345072 [Suillus variegatus]|nr:hypothetical protein EV424DRAFT_1345072 [Suillus variegatus]
MALLCVTRHTNALPWGLERCKESFAQYAATLDQDHEDNARIALRLAIVTGCGGFLKSTDATLIWDGVFDWKDDERTTEDFDWLVNFLVHFREFEMRDFDAMGDALLALSAMRDLGSVTRRDNYLDAIIFAMEADKPSRLRHTALRAMFDARFKLVEIVDEEKGEFREKLLGELAPALFTATKPIAPQLSDDDPDSVFNPRRDDCYLRLIFTLAKQSDWRAHLERAGHIERCTSLLGHVIRNSSSTSPVTSHSYYLVAILIQMHASGGHQSLLGRAALYFDEFRPAANLAATLPAASEARTSPGFPNNVSGQEWWKLLKAAWSAMRWNDLYLEEEAVEALPGIVTYTLDLLETPISQYDAGGLVRLVDLIYEALGNGEAKLEVKRLQDALVDHSFETLALARRKSCVWDDASSLRRHLCGALFPVDRLVALECVRKWSQCRSVGPVTDETAKALPGIITYTLDLLKTPTDRYDAASLVRWVDQIIYKGLGDDR